MIIQMSVVVNLAIAISISASVVFGFVGNMVLAAAIYKSPELHCKSAYLLLIVILSHSISIICEIPNAFYSIALIYGVEIQRKMCYILISPYMFTFLHQTVAIFVMVLDLLTAIIRPIWHKSTDNMRYVTILSLLPIFVGLINAAFIFMKYEDGVIMRCNPIAVVTPPYHVVQILTTTIINIITLITYALALLFFKFKKSFGGIHMNGILKRVGYTALIFACSWFAAVFGSLMANIIPMSGEARGAIQGLMVIPSLFGYSSHFFVYWFRSMKYRIAIKRILGMTSAHLLVTGIRESSRTNITK